MSLNFLKVRPGLRVSVPLRFVNEDKSPALSRGAYVLPISRKLSCILGADFIPDDIEVDLTGVVAKEVIRIDRASIPGAIRVLNTDPNLTLAIVVGKRMK